MQVDAEQVLERMKPMLIDAPVASGSSAASSVTPGPPLRPVDTNWVESTLAGMTLDQKIGQMIMPGYSGSSAAFYVANYHVGGFIFLGNNNVAANVHDATNFLQSIASTPLLFSTDCEAGMGARFVDATRFPLNMGAASAYDLDLVREQGRITARECRAVGIQIGFGPVLDVNTMPINPIIGVRAYSDNPSSVTALARAYVEGANAEGMLCTFKHFPGHGASAYDSHLSLPTININTAELYHTHLAPYAQLLGEGVGDLVMSAHVWYPSLNPGTIPWPATLSTAALTDILRDELDYSGCVISDAYNMQGLLLAAGTYDAVKLGVQAGLDIILIPSDVPLAFSGLKDRVLNNEIPEARIDASVRRILALKSRVGMPENVTVPPSTLDTVGHPDNIAIAEQIGRKAVAASLNEDVVPVHPDETLAVFVLNGASSIFYSYNISNFTDAMIAAHANTQVITVSSSPGNSTINNLLNQARTFDKIIVATTNWTPTNYSSQVAFVNAMLDENLPVAVVSFGSPYQWNQYPDLENFLCGFSSHYATQQQMAQIITGAAQPNTNWPVDLDQVDSSVSDWSLYAR